MLSAHAHTLRRGSPTHCWLGCLVLTTWLSACAGTTPSCKVPKAIELEIETSDRVNVDAEGQSLPTLLRLYQLKDINALQTSEFTDIWQGAKEQLGETLVAEEELTTYPGQVVVRRFDRDDKADFLVGVAIFRNPVGTTWRTVNELPLPGDPCQEQGDPDAAPTLTDLRVRMFLEDYRIESVDNFAALPKRSCGVSSTCKQNVVPDELPEARRHRRLRSFEEDASRPQPTVSDAP